MRRCPLVYLFLFLLTACEGLPSMPHTVKAADYFTGPALPAALACQHDDAQALVRALAQGPVSPNAVGRQGMSLLLLALSNRSRDAMRALLERGADPNLQTKLGRDQTPVQPVAFAAGGADGDLLRLLLDRGGDPNSRVNGEPATFRAAWTDRYDQMRLLIERGADLNAADKDGHTLMVQLADLRKYDQVAYLIQRGGDVHKADRVGGTVAFDVQSDIGNYTPSDDGYAAIKQVQHLLEARGVRFPVPHPGLAFQARVRAEDAQRRVWEATVPEGQHWAAVMHQDDLSTGHPQQDLDHRTDAEAAFQVWRKTQPKWSPSTAGGDVPLYNSPPTLEEEAATILREREAGQADSLKWAKQFAGH